MENEMETTNWLAEHEEIDPKPYTKPSTQITILGIPQDPFLYFLVTTSTFTV